MITNAILSKIWIFWSSQTVVDQINTDSDTFWSFFNDCQPFSSCSTWVTSPLCLFFFFFLGSFFGVRRKYVTSLSGSAEVDRLSWRCTWKTMPGCKQAHAISCYMHTTTQTEMTNISCTVDVTAQDFTPLMDIPSTTKAHYQRADSYLAAWVPVLAPDMSLSPQRGVLWCLRIAAHNLTQLIQGGAGADLEGDNRFLRLCFCASERKKKRCCLSHDTRIQAAVNGDR